MPSSKRGKRPTSPKPERPMRRLVKKVVVLVVGLYVALIGLYAWKQRELLYYPSHRVVNTPGLTAWWSDGSIMGAYRVVDGPKVVWLFLHGNAGQADDRVRALARFAPEDSVYFLEYPGFGLRAGKPTMETIDAAAADAYRALRRQYPKTPVCVAAESLGSGPACTLASLRPAPDKIVLAVPFDRLSSVASDHYPFLPSRWILLDDWNNVKALAGYQGPIDIFGAQYDSVIPVQHAAHLASTLPQAHYLQFPGEHGDWAISPAVTIRYP